MSYHDTHGRGGGPYFSAEMQSVYSTAPADLAGKIWVTFKEDFEVKFIIFNNIFCSSTFYPVYFKTKKQYEVGKKKMLLLK